MARRIIEIERNQQTGEMTIDIREHADRLLDRVTVKNHGDAWIVAHGARSGPKRTSDADAAFRLALRAATERVTEDLLA
jgi:hypothetical protein